MLSRFWKCNAFWVDRPTMVFQHNGCSHMRNLFQNTFKSQAKVPDQIDRYGVPEFIFSSSPVLFSCVVAVKAISQRSFVPRDFFPKDIRHITLFNKLLWEIVSLATKPLFFISLIQNKFGNAVFSSVKNYKYVLF